MTVKSFDLNIERILEDWEIFHAIREVIANAIDEQILTKTRNIKIFKDDGGRWHIRDFGRGLKYKHLTQKENEEKLMNPNVIGKFGIGLKDALATFHRHGVEVLIKSKYGDITIGKSVKHGFKDIITLHAFIHPPSEPNLIGTDFILDGVSDEDIDKAKNLFLRFSGEKVLEKTKYGDVLLKKSEKAKIYINGVKVAEEENFLFSYNITSLTRKIKQALNRERTNVGRGAYSDRIKAILLSCKSKEVANHLIDDLERYREGQMHDELKWIDIQIHAVKILNAVEKAVFFTSDELLRFRHMVDEARLGGYKIVVIPNALKEKIKGLNDISGKPVRDLNQFYVEYEESFEFSFINPRFLCDDELKIFNKTKEIFDLIGGKPDVIKDVKISESMRKKLGMFVEVTGLWDPKTRTIIIKRDQLQSIEKYAGTLLHETAHAISNTDDVSREFEACLTMIIGKLSKAILDKKN